MTETAQHFSTEPGGTPTAAGRYVRVDDVEPVEFVAGLAFRPILGEGSLVNFVSFEPETEAPMHVHVEEQFSIVLDGEFEFEIDGDDPHHARRGCRGDPAVGSARGAHQRHERARRSTSSRRLAALSSTTQLGRAPPGGRGGLMELHLVGRRALVTGGSKGIGLAIAEELAAEGADVAICARHDDRGRERRRRACVLPGRTVHAQTTDVTDAEQVQRPGRATAAALGGLDILVNNAGAAHPGNFETLTDEDWRGDLDVKLFSQIRCTREALPHLRASTAPRVININSVYARYPDPAFFATTVNRAACLNLSKALARELAATASSSTASTSASW